ncbi:BlaI/MecI/CopY family transcriptional regulator [Rhodococcus aetherivorans]|uniref:BlaI/MecI/CopY family transcriptional regulator n=1 Tax=Rhodococcus aetherivorans TaxID=191292 RepID=UPI0006787A04|nr:BlaI/MecI/CopY family transcriptional regulator [Rhodococcus aetherivorans]UGQ40978.1 BlaI/MecI/CopY family transcriptional regulator [Rhodococcus aetherivorans]
MARRLRGTLEQEIVDVLAGAKEPLTVARVNELLPGALAHTTVMTTLARMHGKGILDRTPSGRGYAYRLAAPIETLPAAQAARDMHRLLDKYGRRADVLARFVAELTPDDERMLLRLLGREDGEPDEGREP